MDRHVPSVCEFKMWENYLGNYIWGTKGSLLIYCHLYFKLYRFTIVQWDHEPFVSFLRKIYFHGLNYSTVILVGCQVFSEEVQQGIYVYIKNTHNNCLVTNHAKEGERNRHGKEC